jgi:hypothetical protein
LTVNLVALTSKVMHSPDYKDPCTIQAASAGLATHNQQPNQLTPQPAPDTSTAWLKHFTHMFTHCVCDRLDMQVHGQQSLSPTTTVGNTTVCAKCGCQQQLNMQSARAAKIVALWLAYVMLSTSSHVMRC